VAVPAAANVVQFSLRASLTQEASVGQQIGHNGIGLPDQGLGLNCEQAGITGACAN
jgi:hypothetical protein